MNITDCFDRVKTAVTAAQSTLSKRSIARAPKSTRRQINAHQVVMSLNNLRAHLGGNHALERKIQKARTMAVDAFTAVLAGDQSHAREQMATCYSMVLAAESLYLQIAVTVEVQPETTESNLEGRPCTANTPAEPEAASIDSGTGSDEPTVDLAMVIELRPMHLNGEVNQ